MSGETGRLISRPFCRCAISQISARRRALNPCSFSSDACYKIFVTDLTPEASVKLSVPKNDTIRSKNSKCLAHEVNCDRPADTVIFSTQYFLKSFTFYFQYSEYFLTIFGLIPAISFSRMSYSIMLPVFLLQFLPSSIHPMPIPMVVMKKKIAVIRQKCFFIISRRHISTVSFYSDWLKENNCDQNSSQFDTCMQRISKCATNENRISWLVMYIFR